MCRSAYFWIRPASVRLGTLVACPSSHSTNIRLRFDIVYSARVGCVPRFSCPRQLKPLLGDSSWEPDAQASKMLSTYGSHLRPSPDGVIPDHLDQSLVEIFQVMSVVTVALDHYCRGGEGAPDSLDVMLNNCDWAAHTTLSISPYTCMSTEELGEEAKIDDSCILREISRLCALLHVDMVLLPTPPHTGIKLRHAANILRLLEVLDKQQPIQGGKVPELLTWATVLGAIAARFTELEDRYCARIDKLAQGTPWDVVKACLQRHLWFGPVYDDPACGLWDGAVKHGYEEPTPGVKGRHPCPLKVN